MSARPNFGALATLSVIAATIAAVMLLGEGGAGRPAAAAMRSVPEVLRAAPTHPKGSNARAGKIRFVRTARTDFEPFIAASSGDQRHFIRTHYWRLRGYPPFSDPAIDWGPPAHFYDDLYALDPTIPRIATLIDHHPDWILRDGDGNPLYVPFACNEGSCPAYAADPGNPEWRRDWIARAKKELKKGYVGIFIDNVNLDLHVGDGSGAAVTPIDPRTGVEMTLEDWRRYVTGFVAKIRKAFPGTEIVHNAVWFSSGSLNSRQVRSADYVELERGFTDPGVIGGDGSEYMAMLQYVDWVHSLNSAVMLEPYGLDHTTRLFELASYFLINAGDDAIASEYEADPDNWWPGWQTNLGPPQGPRKLVDGLVRRDFARGIVLVNPPGSEERTLVLPRPYLDLEGAVVETITLGPSEAAILRDPG